MNRLMVENLYKKEWESLENEATQPRFLGKVISFPFSEFSQKVLAQEPGFVRSIVESMYSGDVYILKNAFPAEFMRSLIATLHEHGRQSPSEFYKMLDGCPDFHRIITPELASNYALRQIKHSYYFFSWNNDPFCLFEPIYKRWGVFKFLGGFQFDEYEKNIPSTGVVDRLQIAHYPSGIGELELHSDPFLHQKMAISGIMSKRGNDYMSGGAYVIDKNKNRVDVEDDMDVGDIYIVYPTVLHGVETIDKGKPLDWNSVSGRWFMGLYSNASDFYAKRHTCYGVEEAFNKGNIDTITHKS